MKHLKSFCVALAMLVSTVSFAQSPVSFGDAKLMNEGWLFQLADNPQAAQAEFNDQRWQRVTLPHDWGVTLPMSPDRGSCQGYLPGGIGWYRCHFKVEKAELQNYVYFEGVYNRSTVYINGHELGTRPSGFASFMYDLTPYLKPGQDNVLAVRVDHSRQNDSRWYTGSGIYRNVWLVSAPAVHLAQWGTAWRCHLTDKSQKNRKKNSTKVTALECSVEVDVETESSAEKMQETALRALVEIQDAAGTIVASGGTNIGASEKKTVTLQVPNPQLWSLKTPYLYKVVTKLMDGETEVDRSEVPMGLRSLEFSPDKGFALNGEWMKVKGVCVHDDAGVLGTAVPASVWKLRLQTLKGLGVNAIRMSHNPHAPIVYALCDTLGLLVMDEASDEWEFPKRKWLKGWNQGTPGYEGSFDYFEEWIDRDVADMVRRDRCHPSIFLWSIGNEVDYPNDPYSHPVLNGDNSMTQPIYGGYKPSQPNAERIGVIAQRLSKIVRDIDNSRAVTGALAGVVMSNATAYPEAVDVVGYNYTESRYKEDHEKYPNRVIYGSENRHDLPSWKAVTDNEHIFGQFLWTGIDYLGESGAWPARGSEAGLLDLAGLVKPNGYYRASLWSETPMCYVGAYPLMQQRGRRNQSNSASQYAPALWNYEDGQRVRVVCYTNAGSARLLLNGEAVGDLPKRDEGTGILYWDIVYHPGVLRCEALDGELVESVVASSELKTSNRPFALRATEISGKTDATGKGADDVMIVMVEVVDEDGNLVTLADNEITCRVQGGRLLGLENGDIRDTRDKNQPRCRVKNGRLVAYVKSLSEAQRTQFGQGPDSRETQVTFSSPLLKGVSLRFQ